MHSVPVNACGSLYQCGSCGLVLRVPCLGGDDLRSLYTNMPEEGMKVYAFETNSAWVQAHKKINDDSLVLDIGCNLGTFLAALPDGTGKYAVEPSSVAVEECKRKGIEIVADFVENVPKKWHNVFDVVCMFDILEHLPSPLCAMETALQCLKPGGSLYISTMNWDHWTWGWTGEDHWYLNTPQHVTLATYGFFAWFCVQAETPCRIGHVQKISHQLKADSRVKDLIAVFHWGCLLRGGIWRVPQRLIQMCSWWSQFAHRQSPPYTPSVHDHLFVELIRDSGHREFDLKTGACR